MSTEKKNPRMRPLLKYLKPFKFNKAKKTFINSVSDVFDPSLNELQIDQIFSAMALAPEYNFHISTKYPEIMATYFALKDRGITVDRTAQKLFIEEACDPPKGWCSIPWPLSNVWLGVNIRNQIQANQYIPLLMRCQAKIRWLNCDPLLGPIDLLQVLDTWDFGLLRPDWVVVGGEIGKFSSPMHPLWARDIKNQCFDLSIPFYFRRWGDWAPVGDLHSEVKGSVFVNKVNGAIQNEDPVFYHKMKKVGNSASGRILDGLEHNGYPEA